jgi:hypothetical protein
MKPYDVFTGVLLLVLSAVVFADTVRLGIWPAGAGTMPVIASVLLAACSVVLINSFRRKGGTGKGPSWPDRKGRTNLIFVAVLIAAYLAGMGTIGFLLSTFLFVAVLLHRLSTYGWPKTIVVGLAISIVCFWFFEKLGLTLPRWLLERYLV